MKPDREHLRAIARKGGLAKAAKMRAARGELAPYDRPFLTLLEATGHNGPSWGTWATFWRVADGLPLSEAELDVFRAHTGRHTPPTGPAVEVWVIAGRRSGKSENMTLRATWRAISFDRSRLARGEVGTLPLVASDKEQARNTLGYLKGLVTHPDVAPYVARVMRDQVEFRTGAVVRVVTASFKATRGFTYCDAILEECAFYTSESSANPDEAIVRAIRPALLTVPGARLYAISSPYARAGILWTAFSEHFGHDGDPVLIWNSDTVSLNPTVDRAAIAREFETDPTSAASEYGSEGRVAFRTDVERFLSSEAIEGVVNHARPLELPPQAGVRYLAWVDPSGGSQDSMVLGIAHREGDRAVLDVLRERKPRFDPRDVCREFAELLKAYRIYAASGDHYAAAWVVAGFQEHGIEFRASSLTKSDVYREILAPINSGRVELPDHKPLKNQLGNLERIVTRSGRDSIGAMSGTHDDLSDAAMGACLLAVKGGQNVLVRPIGFWAPSKWTGYRPELESGGGTPRHLTSVYDYRPPKWPR